MDWSKGTFIDGGKKESNIKNDVLQQRQQQQRRQQQWQGQRVVREAIAARDRSRERCEFFVCPSHPASCPIINIYYIINYHPSLPLDPSSLIFHLVISYSIKYQSPLHVFIPYLHLAISRLLVIVRGCISHNIFTSDNQQYQFLIHLH